MSEQPMHQELHFDLIDRLHKSLRVSDKTALSIGADLDVHRNTINNYLSGRTHPSRRTLIAWALATGVPLEWLEHGTVPGQGDGPDGGGWAPRGSNPEPTGSTNSQVIPLFKAA